MIINGKEGVCVGGGVDKAQAKALTLPDLECERCPRWPAVQEKKRIGDIAWLRVAARSVITNAGSVPETGSSPVSATASPAMTIDPSPSAAWSRAREASETHPGHVHAAHPRHAATHPRHLHAMDFEISESLVGVRPRPSSQSSRMTVASRSYRSGSSRASTISAA